MKGNNTVDEYYKIKRNRCKFSQPDLRDGEIKYSCLRNGMADDKVIHNVSEECCDACPHFSSKFIEYPISVTSIDVKHDISSLRKNDIGKLVRIRPCAEEHENKTYLGIFIGDLPQAPHISHNPTTGVLTIRPMMNPAFFVPKLKKVIFGCESWWSFVNAEDDLQKDITDELISDQWYVKALKAMCGGESNGN